MRMEAPDIKYLFEPRAIAVIGASQDESKIGFKILNNIVSGGYSGKIYPVNPGGGRILGLPVCRDINDAVSDVDMACIVVPATRVFDAVKRCAEKRVKFNLIISSGFSEVGNREEEKKIVTYAREHNMRVMGPNIFGMFSATSSLNATFGPNGMGLLHEIIEDLVGACQSAGVGGSSHRPSLGSTGLDHHNGFPACCFLKNLNKARPILQSFDIDHDDPGSLIVEEVFQQIAFVKVRLVADRSHDG
jgi:predicted CoA-binding protein